MARYFISSYVYDYPNTDMECCYGTRYSWYDSDADMICGDEGWQHERPKDDAGNFITFTSDWTPEVIAAYKRRVIADYDARVKSTYDRFLPDVEKYNESLRPQETDQIVEVLSGRRKGITGRISWFGKNQYKVDKYASRYNKGWRAAAILAIANYKPFSIPNADSDLIRVWPTDGSKPFYIDIDKVKVVEGFKPIILTLEMCKKYCGCLNGVSRKLSDGYNYNVCSAISDLVFEN